METNILHSVIRDVKHVNEVLAIGRERSVKVRLIKQSMDGTNEFADPPRLLCHKTLQIPFRLRSFSLLYAVHCCLLCPPLKC